MWKKLIFGIVLVAFVSLQMVNALTCYYCDSPSACRNPSTQECNNQTANATSDWLNAIHGNVPKVQGSTTFKCMNLKYDLYTSPSTSYHYLGCYHPAINVCNLSLNVSQNGGYGSKSCMTCNQNKCNPAGTFSTSFFTILGSILALFLAKLAI